VTPIESDPDGGSDREAEILRARAEALARPLDRQHEDAVYETVVVVTVGDEKLGLPASSMTAILQRFAITPVFGTPPWLAGVAHLRGELFSVIRLEHWLGQREASRGEQLAVIAGPDGLLGILIDEVLGFRDIREDELSEALAPAASERRFTRAVTKDLISILDVPRLIASSEIVVDHG